MSSFVLNMQGGKKGLFVNSTDLCKRKHSAIVELDAHNGREHDYKTELKPQCKGKAKKGK